MTFNAAPTIAMSRTPQFEQSTALLGYTELGHVVVRDLFHLGIADVCAVENLAYRLADAEPPITGENLEAYSKGIEQAIDLISDRMERITQ